MSTVEHGLFESFCANTHSFSEYDWALMAWVYNQFKGKQRMVEFELIHAYSETFDGIMPEHHQVLKVTTVWAKDKKNRKMIYILKGVQNGRKHYRTWHFEIIDGEDLDDIPF